MKKALLTLSALALCVAAGSALAKEYKELRFGVDPSYAPFESKAADGSLVGFDIDLGNAICAELKVKCKWVESDFDGMIPGLKANKFDGVISSMTVTPVREKAIDFSNELFSGPTSLVFKKGAGYSTPESLKGKSVGYEQGTIQEAYAKAAEKGLAAAQNNLGTLYERGMGVAVDFNNAGQLYMLAANQGHAAATTGLRRPPATCHLSPLLPPPPAAEADSEAPPP